MSLIYWDTMLFVYLLEPNPRYEPRVREVRLKMQDRGDTLCTSIFTLGELLVGCYESGIQEAAPGMRAALQPPYVEVLPFTPEVSDRYGQIRAANKVTAADAIHLATAATAGVNLFLTNDTKLKNLTIPGIDFVAALDVNLF